MNTVEELARHYRAIVTRRRGRIVRVETHDGEQYGEGCFLSLSDFVDRCSFH